MTLEEVGQDEQGVMALLGQGGKIAAEVTGELGAVGGAKTAGDLLLDFSNSQFEGSLHKSNVPRCELGSGTITSELEAPE